MSNYLIEGGSGTGKTTVAEELERRGFFVVHGDRTLAYYGDPETGAALKGGPFDSEVERVRWGYVHWIWPVERVRELVADQGHPITFFCGHSANFHQFIGLFDRVFVLRVGLATLHRRLASRPDDEFGGRPVERDLITHLHGTREDMPEDATEIDADAPVARVVDDILMRCDLA